MTRIDFWYNPLLRRQKSNFFFSALLAAEEKKLCLWALAARAVKAVGKVEREQKAPERGRKGSYALDWIKPFGTCALRNEKFALPPLVERLHLGADKRWILIRLKVFLGVRLRGRSNESPRLQALRFKWLILSLFSESLDRQSDYFSFFLDSPYSCFQIFWN